MGILEKISEIEKEIARTQKNKGKSKIRVKSGMNFVINMILSNKGYGQTLLIRNFDFFFSSLSSYGISFRFIKSKISKISY